MACAGVVAGALPTHADPGFMTSDPVYLAGPEMAYFGFAAPRYENGLRYLQIGAFNLQSTVFPPDAGGPVTARVQGQTLIGGAMWQSTPLGWIELRFAHLAQDGAVSRFSAELVGFEFSGVTGDTLSEVVAIRESPGLASLGEATIEEVGVGVYRVTTYFDVFTEVSTDGGFSWSPSIGAVRFEAVPVPASALPLFLVLGVARRRRLASTLKKQATATHGCARSWSDSTTGAGTFVGHAP